MKQRSVCVRAPKNFSWQIVEGRSYLGDRWAKVQLVRGTKKKVIGEVTLYEQDSGVWETHSWLDTRYHGKGYGTKLYARAIQWGMTNKVKVQSSGCTSEEAQRVWRGKSIRKYFRIVTKPYKWLDDTYADPSMDVFHAYRKPNRRK